MSRYLAPARCFAEQSRRFETKTDLAASLEACARDLGFRYFALLHHVDLRKRPRATVHIDNYPDCWSEHFIENRLFLEDPVLRASVTTNIGFPWTDVPTLIRMGPKQLSILEHARRAGLENGITVPANIPGEAHGSCSFACNCPDAIATERQLAAQLVGGFAFQAARRICCATNRRGEAVQLTPRQRDCVELVAQGKTDWEIGMILGLEEDSVTKNIAAARLRYDVANRTELVVAALFDGQICFSAVRHWQYLFQRKRG